MASKTSCRSSKTTFEARYYLATNKNRLCVGCYGGTSDKFTVDQILDREDITADWIADLVQRYDTFLPGCPISPDPGSMVHIAMAQELDPNHVILKFWFSPRLTPTLTYRGKVEIQSQRSEISGCNLLELTSYQWDASLDCIMLNYIQLSKIGLEQFWMQETIFQSEMLILELEQVDIYVPPTLKGYFRSIGEHPAYIKAKSKCPPDCYLFEIRTPPRGWFAYLPKTDWDAKSVERLNFQF